MFLPVRGTPTPTRYGDKKIITELSLGDGSLLAWKEINCVNRDTVGKTAMMVLIIKFTNIAGYI